MDKKEKEIFSLHTGNIENTVDSCDQANIGFKIIKQEKQYFCYVAVKVTKFQTLIWASRQIPELVPSLSNTLR